eukprot:3662020-Prymnesium_polylepis.1
MPLLPTECRARVISHLYRPSVARSTRVWPTECRACYPCLPIECRALYPYVADRMPRVLSLFAYRVSHALPVFAYRVACVLSLFAFRVSLARAIPVCRPIASPLRTDREPPNTACACTADRSHLLCAPTETSQYRLRVHSRPIASPLRTVRDLPIPPARAQPRASPPSPTSGGRSPTSGVTSAARSAPLPPSPHQRAHRRSCRKVNLRHMSKPPSSRALDPASPVASSLPDRAARTERRCIAAAAPAILPQSSLRSFPPHPTVCPPHSHAHF